MQEKADLGYQMYWLESELYEAEQNSQVVFIFGHVPPGHPSCNRQWSIRYQALMERYQHIVRA
jgi:sphingomyelin phosphodiesterase